jgi:hypothetical protein
MLLILCYLIFWHEICKDRSPFIKGMAEQTIIIPIKGYWRDQHKRELAGSPGIFFVYEAHFDESQQTVDLLNLIYIGAAVNIRRRILEHEGYNYWKRYISPGNELCFAYASVDSKLRERVKAAYILSHKPAANPYVSEPFLYDKTTLVSTGQSALMNPVVTVYRNTLSQPETFAAHQRNDLIPVRAVHLINGRPERQFAFGR